MFLGDLHGIRVLLVMMGIQAQFAGLLRHESLITEASKSCPSVGQACVKHWASCRQARSFCGQATFLNIANVYVLPHVEPSKVRASDPYIILKGDSDSKRCFFQSVHCRRGKCYGAGGVASLRPVLLEFYHAPLLLGAVRSLLAINMMHCFRNKPEQYRFLRVRKHKVSQ